MHRAARYAVTGFLAVWLAAVPGLSSAYPQQAPNWTNVEKKFIAQSGRQETYLHEYIPIIEAKNSYDLGKLTALKFIEWAANHPTGVMALTSGNTPENFIKFLYYYKKNWRKPQVQAELHSYGIMGKNFPDTSNMKFVQIEEYFPISPKHSKNVTNYIKKHYLNFFGISKDNVLLMDLTSKGIIAEKGLKLVFMNGKIDLDLMQRKAGSQLEIWQQQAIREAQHFCDDYEKKIRAWGGIDFFLGSLSYGGRLGFNKQGTALNAKTHIVKLDYMSAAHAAKELGGIEYAKGKVAVTIGLGTITYKPNAVIIVLTAGDSKAQIVKNAVETPYTLQNPTSILQKFPNARLYINSSAAKLLNDRRVEDLIRHTKNAWSQQHIDAVVIEIALAQNKAITNLTEADLNKYDNGRLLLESGPQPLPQLLQNVKASVIEKIDNGLKLGLTKPQKILHTAPHHDDIILGYYPLFDTFMLKSQNHFAHLTSGSNSVSDTYILSTINRASEWWLNKEKDTILNKPYSRVVSKFRNMYNKQDQEQMNMLDTTITLKHLVEIYDIKSLAQLKQTIRWLKDEYFPNKQPGDSDVASIKLLKGMIRESEVDRLLSLKDIPLEHISHLRSKFYYAKDFVKTPRVDADVAPFIKLYNEYMPDMITVQDDPQSAPPATHYKTKQIIAQALRDSRVKNTNNLQILGYRNIWFKYKPHEANIFVPVSAKMMELQKQSFAACFNTQKTASFPSPFFDGVFSQLSANIQNEQLAELKVLLGDEYFSKNKREDLKNAAGFIYLKNMNTSEFVSSTDDLQKSIELEDVFEQARYA